MNDIPAAPAPVRRRDIEVLLSAARLIGDSDDAVFASIGRSPSKIRVRKSGGKARQDHQARPNRLRSGRPPCTMSFVRPAAAVAGDAPAQILLAQASMRSGRCRPHHFQGRDALRQSCAPEGAGGIRHSGPFCRSRYGPDRWRRRDLRPGARDGGETLGRPSEDLGPYWDINRPARDSHMAYKGDSKK